MHFINVMAILRALIRNWGSPAFSDEGTWNHGNNLLWGPRNFSGDKTQRCWSSSQLVRTKALNNTESLTLSRRIWWVTPEFNLVLQLWTFLTSYTVIYGRRAQSLEALVVMNLITTAIRVCNMFVCSMELQTPLLALEESFTQNSRVSQKKMY